MSITVPQTPEEHRLWWAEQTDVPYGYCWCGCGEKTGIAKESTFRRFRVAGCPYNYVVAHNFRKVNLDDLSRSCTVDPITGCWLWNHSLFRNGYARLGKHIAHRVVYEHYKGPIPEGMDLDHLCRVKRCVNPDHLEPVTEADNVRRGVSAKLTPAQVLEIRRLTAEGFLAQEEIGARFGITSANVSAIHRRKSWREL